MKPCNKGHYGHFVDIDHYGLAHYGHRFDQYWCLFEEQEKCRSTVKAELKNMHRFKSYGQNKIDYEIMAIFFVFWAYFLTENDHSRGSTSHGSSEVIFMFLESVEQCEWD